MAANSRGPQTPSGADVHSFKLKPGVYYEDVPWFREEGVFQGKRLNRRSSAVRLYSPEGAPAPPYVDVQSYWVTLAKE